MRIPKDKILILSVLLVAFLVRLVYIIAFKDHILIFQAEVFGDTRQYVLMAENLLSGKGLMISPALLAYRPPLYPVFLSGIYYLFGNGYWPIRIAQIILDSLSCIMVYILGRRIFNPKVGILASLIYAFYPFFIYYTGFELTETMFIFLIVLVMLYLVKAVEKPHPKNFVLAGILVGLSSLCRPTMLAFFFVASVGIAVTLKAKGLVAVRNIGILFLFFVITIAPWTIRNHLVFHRFIPITAVGGRVLWEGNNPKSMGGPCQYWPEEIEELSEIEQDRYLARAAINLIKHNPARFLKLMGIKFVRFWNVIPNAPQYSRPRDKIISLSSYGLILPFSIVGMLLSWKMWRKTLLLYLLIAFFTLFHMVFLASIRYRDPIMPFVIIFAAHGFWLAIKRIRGDIVK